ncbi:beta strand repeat-containing protein [Rickettsiales bacterium LUAb2]
MSVEYKLREILVAKPTKALAKESVYAGSSTDITNGPDQGNNKSAIRLDFVVDPKEIKVVAAHGDITFIYKDGSMTDLVNYLVMFSQGEAPDIYDKDGKLVSVQDLLQYTQVYTPQELRPILANRDKYTLVNPDKKVDEIKMATQQSGDLEGGNPIAGQGDLAVRTEGLPSDYIDRTGVTPTDKTKDNQGNYLYTSYHTNIFGKTDTDKTLMGNTKEDNVPNVSYTFLYGNQFQYVANKGVNVNGQAADYYGVVFGVGNDSNNQAQLDQLAVSLDQGSNDNKFIDAHSSTGMISYTLQLKYGKGIFPQGIDIKGIPTGATLSSSGSTGTTQFIDNGNGSYTLTRLDPSGLLNLIFKFPESMPNTVFSIEYDIKYFDPSTGELKTSTNYQDVGIRKVSTQTDLNLNSVVLSSSAAGVNVTTKGGTNIIVGGQYQNTVNGSLGNNLILTGAGRDDITLSSGKNVVYGSLGYDTIKGAAGGDNTVVFNNDKSYATNKGFSSNQLDQHPDYYNTMTATSGLSFYFGVNSPLQLWDQLGLSGYYQGFRDQATSDFMTTNGAITIMSNITTIVGSNSKDVFNLYFQGVSENLVIDGGTATNSLVINGSNGDTVTIDTANFNQGGNYYGKITSANNGQSTYSYKLNTINSISGGDEVDRFIIKFNPGNINNVSMTYNGSHSKNSSGGMPAVWNVADFSQLGTTASITFNAATNMVSYNNIPGKTTTDSFYNINTIYGTSNGDDIFIGSTTGAGYQFYAGAGANTSIQYMSGGAHGITIDFSKPLGTDDYRVYKTASSDYAAVTAYGSYDEIKDFKIIKLSDSDDFIFAGDTDITVDGNGGFNTVSYNSSNISGIDHIIVDISAVTNGQAFSIDKYATAGPGTPSGHDSFKNVQGFIGTKSGDDIFYGGSNSVGNSFDGNGGTNNTLSYDKVTNMPAGTGLVFVIKEGTVAKPGGEDDFKNIQNIIGSKGGNDLFRLGSFDPSNQQDITDFNKIHIDGNDGNNTFSFRDAKLPDAGVIKGKYFLTYDVDNSLATFVIPNGTSQVNLTAEHINTIQGTAGLDHFIASDTTKYNFQGYSTNQALLDTGNFVFGNMLDYSSVNAAVIIDVKNGSVNVGGTNRDSFSEINSFVGGKADSTIQAYYTYGGKASYYDGYAQASTTKGYDGTNITGTTDGNVLSYKNVNLNLVFDMNSRQVQLDPNDHTKFDKFEHFTVIEGGGKTNTYMLSESVITWDVNAALAANGDVSSTATWIRIKPNGGNNIIDFSSFNNGLTNFDVSSTNSQGITTGIYYDWSDNGAARVTGYKGTLSKSDTFIDNQVDRGYSIDGNSDGSDTPDGNVLDLTNMVKAGSTVGINYNMAIGQVTKNASDGTSSVDKISNINTINLAKNSENIVYYDQPQTGVNLPKTVNGGANDLSNPNATNTISFEKYGQDVTTTIDGVNNGFILTEFGITFNHFDTMRGSKLTTTYNVTDASNNANVKIELNPMGKKSILDFTQTGGVTYYNFNNQDNIAGVTGTPKAGDASWDGGKSANIYNNFTSSADHRTDLVSGNYVDVTGVDDIKLGSTGDNTVYASNYNHAAYLATSAGTNSIRYDWTGFVGAVKVVLDADHDGYSRVSPTNTGGYDFYKGFSTFYGTALGDDTYYINNVSDIQQGVTYNGGGGNNTLSFAGDGSNGNTGDNTEDINIDISQSNIQVNGVTISVTNVKTLELGSGNSKSGGTGHNTVSITGTSPNLIFDTVKGGTGSNVINTFVINRATPVTFNETGHLNQIVVTGVSPVTIYNFQEITVSGTGAAATGNMFYGLVQNDIKYTVTNAADADNNTLSYNQNSTRVFVDFTTQTVFKGSPTSSQKDTFSGINKFNGSTGADTFYLTNSKANMSGLSHIYINDYTLQAGEVVSDTISTIKITSDTTLDLSTQKITGSDVDYNWKNIANISIKNNDTVIDDFGFRQIPTDKKGYNITNGDTNGGSNLSTIEFDNTKSSVGGPYAGGLVVVDVALHTATKYASSADYNSKTVLAEDTFNKIGKVVGTSNNDIFYAGIDNMTFDGNAGDNTLDYSKFSGVNGGVTFTFTYTGGKFTADINKGGTNNIDHASNITTYRGTIYNDTFILADTSGGTPTNPIKLDGNGGSGNIADLRNITTAATLDTTNGGLGNLGVSLTNISRYQLNNQDNMVYGSIDNYAFIPVGSLQTSYSINIIGGSGSNTIDYSTKILQIGGATVAGPTALNHWSMKLYFSSGSVIKSAPGAGAGGTDISGSDVVQNFNTYIFNGNFTDIYVSAGNDTQNSPLVAGVNGKPVTVQIKNAMANNAGIYTADFSEITGSNVVVNWGNANTGITSSINGVNTKTTFIGGFTIVKLGNTNSTVNVSETDSTLGAKSQILAAGGNNLLNITAANAVTIDISQIGGNKFTLGGGDAVGVTNFTNFTVIGNVDTTVKANDSRSYNLKLADSIEDSRQDKVDYTTSTTAVTLDFGTSPLTSSTNLVATVTKGGANVKTDTITNANYFTLTNSNDTVKLVANNTGKMITIDANGGTGNQVSFENYANLQVIDVTSAGAVLPTGNYTLIGFQVYSLSSEANTLNIAEDAKSSSFNGLAGKNSVFYGGDPNDWKDQHGGVAPTFTPHNFANGITVSESASTNKLVLNILRTGSSDTLEYFNELYLPKDHGSTFIAAVAYMPTPVSGNPAYQNDYTIYFGNGTNTLNYGALGNTGLPNLSTKGINATIAVDTGNANKYKTVVQRDYGSGLAANLVTDNVYTNKGVTNNNQLVIFGSGKDDYFTINSNVQNMGNAGFAPVAISDSASHSSTLNVNFVSDPSQTYTTIVFDLAKGSVYTTNAGGIIQGTIATFVGGTSIDALIATGNKDVTFLIADKDHHTITGDPTSTSNTTLDYSNLSGVANLVITISTFDEHGFTGSTTGNNITNPKITDFYNMSTIKGYGASSTFNINLPATLPAITRDYTLDAITPSIINITNAATAASTFNIGAGGSLSETINGHTLTMNNFNRVNLTSGKYDFVLNSNIATSTTPTNMIIAGSGTIDSFDISKVALLTGTPPPMAINFNVGTSSSGFIYNYGNAQINVNSVANTFVAAASQNAHFVLQSTAWKTGYSLTTVDFTNIDISGLKGPINHTPINITTDNNGVLHIKSQGTMFDFQETAAVTGTITLTPTVADNAYNGNWYEIDLSTLKHKLNIQSANTVTDTFPQIWLNNVNSDKITKIDIALKAGYASEVDVTHVGGGTGQINFTAAGSFIAQSGASLGKSIDSATITLDPNYNYYHRKEFDKLSEGTYIITPAKSTTIDMSNWTYDTGITLIYYKTWPQTVDTTGLEVTNDGTLADFTADATANTYAVFSYMNTFNANFFTDTKVILGSGRAKIGITQSYITSALANASVTGPGVVIDGTKAQDGVNVSYNTTTAYDAVATPGNAYFIYTLTNATTGAAGAGNYTQYSWAYNDGTSTKDLHTSVVNVGLLNSQNSINEEYIIKSDKVKLQLDAGTGNNSNKTVTFDAAYTMGASDKINITLAQGVTGQDYGLITGSIGTNNATIVNFATYNFSGLTMNTVNTNQEIKLNISYMPNANGFKIILPNQFTHEAHPSTFAPFSAIDTIVPKQTLSLTGVGADVSKYDITINPNSTYGNNGNDIHVATTGAAVVNGKSFDVYNAYRIELPASSSTTIQQNDNMNNYYISAPTKPGGTAATLVYGGSGYTHNTVFQQNGGYIIDKNTGGTHYYDYVVGIGAAPTLFFTGNSSVDLNYSSHSDTLAQNVNLDTTGAVNINLNGGINSDMNKDIINFSNKMMDNNLSNVHIQGNDNPGNYIVYEIHNSSDLTGSYNTITDSSGRTYAAGNDITVVIDKSTGNYFYVSGGNTGGLQFENIANKNGMEYHSDTINGNNAQAYANYQVSNSTGSVYDDMINQFIHDNVNPSTKTSHDNDSSKPKQPDVVNHAHHSSQANADNAHVVSLQASYSNDANTNTTHDSNNGDKHSEHNDASSLNVLSHNDDFAHVNVNHLNAGDVLEFSNHGHVDSLSKTVIEGIKANNNHEQTHADHGMQQTMNSVHEAGVTYVESIQTYHDSATDSNDPGSKVEDTFHKHQTSHNSSDK